MRYFAFCWRARRSRSLEAKCKNVRRWFKNCVHTLVCMSLCVSDDVCALPATSSCVSSPWWCWSATSCSTRRSTCSPLWHHRPHRRCCPHPKRPQTARDCHQRADGSTWSGEDLNQRVASTDVQKQSLFQKDCPWWRWCAMMNEGFTSLFPLSAPLLFHFQLQSDSFFTCDKLFCPNLELQAFGIFFHYECFYVPLEWL